jgi:carboxymethylenebutenolidase
MVRTIGLAVLLILLGQGVGAELKPDAKVGNALKHPDWSMVVQREVEYRSGQDTVRAWLALPPGPGPFPALIVIHEWWGLNEWVKENAAKFAAAGYAALAIDLYRGRVAAEPELAHELMRGLPPDRASRDLRAAMDYLKGRPEVRADRIGALGWCMGGGYALTAALELPELAAGVINYGHLVSEPTSIARIHSPVLGIFGADDQGIPPAQVEAFAAAAKAAGTEVQVQIYPGVGHAFLRSAPESPAAIDAWARTWQFLGAALKP